ncbi:putative cartilage matrix-associated protein [Camelus ferus]|nr:putative cartilage matrix-associated protein [Camelus ferus]
MEATAGTPPTPLGGIPASSLSLSLSSCLNRMLQEGTSVSVGTRQVGGQEAQECVEEIFMRESDASNFLKKRDKRSPKSQDEWRTGSGCGLTSCGEHHEEQRNESENFAEEQNDALYCEPFQTHGEVHGTTTSPYNHHPESAEQEERSREPIEQWRQWHYDGLYPSYLYNRHI